MSRILVIDDEAQIRSMLRRALESAGYEVVDARDGEEGIRVFQTLHPDLVITDILMPEKEGLECIRELRQLAPAVRIIAISGGSSNSPLDLLDLARRFGARRTFWKPLDLEMLVAAVREQLEDGGID
ncbi:MAG TPA: response regulator [Candidatus Eisenbacteria bacterium]|jgi:DNA-binding response OmpR family regulator